MPSGGDPLVGSAGNPVQAIPLPGATYSTPQESVQYGTTQASVPTTPTDQTSYVSISDTNPPPVFDRFNPPANVFDAVIPAMGFVGVHDDEVLGGDTGAGDAFTLQRVVASNNLYVRQNFRFRGKRESVKFLSFLQKTTGSILRTSNNLEIQDDALTSSEELVYPTNEDISKFYNVTAQTAFHEWKRMRKINASWLV